MITPAAIKNVMKKSSLELGIPFVRSDQDGQRPAGIFMSYKITMNERDPEFKAIAKHKDTDSGIEKTVSRKHKIPVSLSFFGLSDEYLGVYSKAQSAYTFFESDEGKSICKEEGIFPRLRGSIQDRSAILETKYETRLGFDIIFDAIDQDTTIVDAVDIGLTIVNMEDTSERN